MIGRIRAVALNTFREAVRDRVLVTLVIFAVVVMGASRVIQPLALGEESKVIKDIGLAAITLFCVLIAILVGGRLVYKEVEKRTIYIILSKPVRRWEFIVGKYFGLLGVLALSLVVMTVCFYAVLWILRVGAPLALVLAVVMTFFELAILTAAAILFSSFATPITGSVFAFGIYFVGHMARDLRVLAGMTPSPVVRVISLVVYYLLPNLSNFNIRGDVVHGAPLDPVGLLLSMFYAVVYSTVLLLVAMAIFSRREF